MKNRHSKLQTRRAKVGVGGSAGFAATAACILLLLCGPAARAAFTFDDIEFWVGSGPNHAALVIDWTENSGQPPALAWGYRWSGEAKGRDMLLAIVEADPRLFIKFNDRQVGNPPRDDPNIVYGIGYDADNDGVFGIADGTAFDAFGKAYGTAPFFGTTAIDPDDFYAEGWTFAFWHYGVEAPAGANPYDGGNWSSTNDGIHTRDLIDGSWDSYAFEGSTTPPFGTFAENPMAAPSPFAPGDFNRDGRVDAEDYDAWKAAFGSTTDPAADANRNGIVDAADYVVWRRHAAAATATAAIQTPEPITLRAVCALAIALFVACRNRMPIVAIGSTGED